MKLKEFLSITNDQEIIDLVIKMGSISKVLREFGISPNHSKIRSYISKLLKNNSIQYKSKKTNSKRYSREDLIAAFECASCWSDIYRHLGLSICGYNKEWIIKFANYNGINVPEFTKEQIKETFKRGKNIPLQYEEIFCENSKYRQPRRVFSKFHPDIKYICSVCGQLPHHNNKDLTLELDHINGNNTDNRKENLRWLCPNCHSQTETFRKKNNLAR